MIDDSGYMGSGRTFSAAALNRQVGGAHYKGFAIQPVEFIWRNGLGFCEGCAIKYITRWRSEGGLEDLRKAIHYLELIISMEEAEMFSEDIKGRACKILEAVSGVTRRSVEKPDPRIEFHFANGYIELYRFDSDTDVQRWMVVLDKKIHEYEAALREERS